MAGLFLSFLIKYVKNYMPKFILFFSVAVIIAVIAYLSQSGFESTSSGQSTSYNDFFGNNKSETTVNTPNTPNTPKTQVLTFEDNLKAQFTKMGWTPKAAHAVINLNKEWLSIQQAENPKGFEKQVYLLKQLGKHSDFMPLFESRPETASLLAAAYNPERLANILREDDCYNIITGLFTQHVAPDDTAALADALYIHSHLICQLINRGLIGSQALFIFPRNNKAAQEYDRWLTEILENALGESEEQLSTIMNLLFEQGSKIRSKMIDNQEFHYSFRKLWAKFVRVTNKTETPFELYLSDEHLWDLLALPKGEQLLTQWLWFLSLEQVNNLTPAEVLFGDQAYPKVLHRFIIDAILEKNSNSLIALLYFGRTPPFLKFMRRNLLNNIKQKAFNVLLALGENSAAAKLEDWNKASNADLYSELVKGDISTFHTFKKIVQGREVSGGEAFWAAADVVDIGYTIATFGTGAIISSSVKLGAKAAVKHQIKKEFKSKMAERIKKVSSKIISNNKLLTSFAKTRIFSKMQTIGVHATTTVTAKHATFDIKPVLEFAFKKMNVNRTTIKRINKNWDARLFMRRDAKVLIQVDHRKLAKGACLFFQITKLIGVVGNVGNVGEQVYCGLNEGFEKVERIAKVTTGIKNFNSATNGMKFRAWQKNNSAWWLMNASH